jgi:transcriptional regulator
MRSAVGRARDSEEAASWRKMLRVDQVSVLMDQGYPQHLIAKMLGVSKQRVSVLVSKVQGVDE